MAIVIALAGCDRHETNTPDENLISQSSGKQTSEREGGNSTQNTISSRERKPTSAFKEIDWPELMPKEDLDALMNPPSYITDIEDGSLEDQAMGQLRNNRSGVPDDPYQRALASTTVIAEMDGQAIKLAGFVVPITYDDDLTITEFFLVPFFGACIHVPPPPPNQIIFIRAPEGVKVEALYDPFWVSGILKTSLFEHDLATSAYTLELHHFERYEYTDEK